MMIPVNQTYRVEESKIYSQKTCHWYQVCEGLGLCFPWVWRGTYR